MPQPTPVSCPPWCARVHGEIQGEDDTVHISEQSAAGNTFLRLASTIDPDTGHQDGPYVLIGAKEYTLDEAEAMAQALSELVRLGHGAPDRTSGCRLPQQIGADR